MKKKLRQIVINEKKYLYAYKCTYFAENENDKLHLRIYESGKKNTPLIIEFLVADSYYVGLPLNSGVTLFNNVKHVNEEININHPGLIRKLILCGIGCGWTGSNVIDIQDGVQYLKDLGYDTTPIEPFPKNYIN